MSQILAWKSDDDGKLFEYEDDYRKHLRGLANKRRVETRKLNKLKIRDALIDRLSQCTSFFEIEKLIESEWKTFYTHSQYFDEYRKIPEFVTFKFSNMQWSKKVANTHSCPKNGVTNWFQQDKPTSYAGWTGSVTLQWKSNKLMTSIDTNVFMIHTGTGGGTHNTDADGNRIYTGTYQVTLWADDFVSMAKLKYEEEVWGVMNADH